MIKMFLFIMLLGLSTCLASTISNIRTSLNNDKQRIVIDLNTEGEPAYYINKNKSSIELTLEAIIDSKNIEGFKELLSNSHYVEEASFLLLPDENESIITLKLKTGTVPDIFSIANPARLVIDLETPSPTGVSR